MQLTSLTAIVISIVIIVIMMRLTLSIARCVLAILCLQNTSRLSHACVWSCLIGFIIIIIGILFIIIIHILLDIVILFKTLPDCHTSVSSCLYHHHRQEGKLGGGLYLRLDAQFGSESTSIVTFQSLQTSSGWLSTIWGLVRPAPSTVSSVRVSCLQIV